MRATEAVDYTGRQCVRVVAVLTGSAIARTEGREWAGPLAGSAGIVPLILTVLLAAHKQRERDYAIERVLEGLVGGPPSEAPDARHTAAVRAGGVDNGCGGFAT